MIFPSKSMVLRGDNVHLEFPSYSSIVTSLWVSVLPVGRQAGNQLQLAKQAGKW